MIKLRIDEYTILPIEREQNFINEKGEEEYFIFEDTVISLPNRDIKLEKNTITYKTAAEEIIYEHLMKQRIISPILASLIYYQVMKKLKIPFRKRLWKFIKSFRNFF